VTDRRNRYPGAQPFVDDPLSRRVFFGRDQASKSLTDQILANQIVVVYAKSGLGKTSLLNAGVASRLREEGYLPLFVRVNDIALGPLASVLEGIRAEVRRQDVEYYEGQPDSLWSFFKTAEFWRGDLLLTPVLILDQFEELFTLHGAQARDSFLSELSFLVRGVAPQTGTTSETLSVGAPPIRIVLALREDHLGLLEEAAEHLPQILDHRFRLVPLSVAGAAAAMTGPAEIDDPALETRPFRFDPAAVDEVLTYLSRHRRRSPSQTGRQVEPFQLQLICQRIEQIVLARQARGQDDITITTKDIGGEATLRETLKDFYKSSVRSLPNRRVRRAVRRLCEEYLISPEGRRLSLEESEIERQLALLPTTLQLLVAKRLLRSDLRSDSSYYELSHDAMIDPVLATRRRTALLFGWMGLVTTSLAVIFFVLAALATLLQSTVAEGNAAESIGATVLVFVPLIIVLMALSRRSLRSLQRYRHRAADELDALSTGRTRAKVTYGVLAIAAGAAMIVLAMLLLLVPFAIASPAIATAMENNEYMSSVRESVARHGVGLDTIAVVVAIPFTALFGVRLIRWGVRKLLGVPTARVGPVSVLPGSTVAFRPIIADALLATAATAAVVAAVVLAGLAVLPYGCASGLPLPDWIVTSTNMIATDCEEARTEGFEAWEAVFGVFFVLAFGSEGWRLLRRRAARLHVRVLHRLIAVGKERRNRHVTTATSSELD
jgi:hypothetical protein